MCSCSSVASSAIPFQSPCLDGTTRSHLVVSIISSVPRCASRSLPWAAELVSEVLACSLVCAVAGAMNRKNRQFDRQNDRQFALLPSSMPAPRRPPWIRGQEQQASSCSSACSRKDDDGEDCACPSGALAH